jgi:hypothetical protein
VAHRHRPELETFFSPRHGVLDGGFLAVAILTVGPLLRRRVPGAPRRARLARGYGWSLAGVLVFLAGGAGDMVWPTLFGLERPGRLRAFTGLAAAGWVAADLVAVAVPAPPMGY